MGNAFGDGNLGWRKDDVGVAVDEKVKTTNADTTADYLDAKLTVDNGVNVANPIEKTVQNPGGNENNRVRFDETKVVHQNISGAGANTHAQLDTGLTNSVNHIADLANPHATDIENLGNGTLAELNAAITDANVDDSGDPRDPNNHAANHTDGTDDIQNATNGQKGLATASQITDLEANTTHRGLSNNPHSVTKAQVGLGNVTNDAQVKKIGASTDNAIARWDLATGDLLQNSLSTLSDAGTLNIPAGETYNINGVSAVKQAFLVASSDSTAEAQRLAGTVINIAADSGAALETLFLTYNSIHLLSGTYNFTTNFDMVAGKALFGSGYFTILTKANAAVTNLIEATTNCTVSNLRLEGVSASYGSGNGIDGNSATDCWFQNIWVNDFGDSGIVNCFGLEQITSENNGEQGLDNCFNMTNINARNNGLNGFNASGRMSSTFSGGNTNDGYEDCVDMSSFYSLGNGRHGLNDCLRVTGGLISGHSGAGDVGVLNSEWVSSTLATGNTINYSGSNFLSSCDGVNSVADDYSNCDYLSSCRSFNAGDDAFYLCDSCVVIYANGANDDGIFQCTRVGFSLAQNSGDDGFNDSFHMGFNLSNTNTGSDFVSCNANGGDSIAVADTATGGYNDS